MRTTYRYDPQRRCMVDRDGFRMVSPNQLATSPEQLCAPQVMRDIQDYQSPITDEWITSRSQRREDLIKHGCVEVDPPRKPRGLKNHRFAKKWRAVNKLSPAARESFYEKTGE